MGDRERILIVDDESNILNALSRELADLELDVLMAEDGFRGLELVEQTENLALVISDQRMPEMNGDVFLSRVRELAPLTLRWVLTGYTDVEAAASLINAGGVQRYITKPWDPDEMRQMVRDAVEYWRVTVENERLSKLAERQNGELKELNERLIQIVQEQTVRLRDQNRELERANRRLKANQRSVLEAFCNLIEMSNVSMGGHSRRVAVRAEALARQMGLSNEAVEMIAMGGLLHDIGKVGIDPALLCRCETELTEEERALVRQHTERGQMALLSIEDFKEVGAIVRHHHEHYNGQGWPDRISGKSIELGARIIAVSNTFDHLLEAEGGVLPDNERRAYTHLCAESGSRLDPSVVHHLGLLLSGAEDTGARWVEKRISLLMLEPGMVLSRDLRTCDGLLVAARGLAMDNRTIDTVWSFRQARRIGNELFIYQAKEALVEVQHAAHAAGGGVAP